MIKPRFLRVSSCPLWFDYELSSLFLRLLGHLCSPLLRSFLHLLWADVLNVRADAPEVSKRIGYLPVAIAPEHIRDRHLDGCASVGCPLERLVNVFDVKVQASGRTTESLRRLVAHLGELVCQKDDGIANLQFSMTNLAVGGRHSHNLLGPSRFLVKLDGGRGI